MARILIVGESWITVAKHVKGVDEFSSHSYHEGLQPLRAAFEQDGHQVDHLPGHRVAGEFPRTREELNRYDVIILSDIGADSIQLAPEVFEQAHPSVDRLALLRDWVLAGGSLLMIGGYLSFAGIQGRAHYWNAPIADVLPVEVLPYDDREERPAGVVADVVRPEHAIMQGLNVVWPQLLGYNRVTAKPAAQVLATVDDHPLVVVGQAGEGRTAAFTSDCSPHWCPNAFCEEWDGYARFFNQLVSWLVERD